MMDTSETVHISSLALLKVRVEHCFVLCEEGCILTFLPLLLFLCTAQPYVHKLALAASNQDAQAWQVFTYPIIAMFSSHLNSVSIPDFYLFNN
jgi:hypothetical protein